MDNIKLARAKSKRMDPRPQTPGPEALQDTIYMGRVFVRIKSYRVYESAL